MALASHWLAWELGEVWHCFAFACKCVGLAGLVYVVDRGRHHLDGSLPRRFPRVQEGSARPSVPGSGHGTAGRL